MSDIALCCASACPLIASCRRHEMHHEERGWINFGAGVHLTEMGTFDCNRMVPFVADEVSND